MSTPLSTTLDTASVVLKRDRTTRFTPVSANGGTEPYFFSISPALPTGLSINTGTGEISGSGRIETATTVYTVTVTDATSPTAQTSFKLFSLEVQAAPNKTNADGLIAAADYNYLRTEVRAILDDLGRDNPAGRSSAGYGQVMQSSAVASGNNITLQQWSNLRLDLLNILVHQQGGSPTITEITSPIRYSATAPNYRFQDLASTYFETRFSIGSGRGVVTEKTSISRTGSWTTQCTTTLLITFDGYVRSDGTSIADIDHARYFFNAGGKIRFISNRTDGDITSQNKSWSDFLSGLGVLQFGGNITDALGFYKLTTAYQEFYRSSPIAPYLTNEYVIQARCNQANNTAGGATELEFLITWTDNYVDPDDVDPSPETFGPGDEVNGTLSLIIEELRPFGPLQPSGNFSVPSPSYSITPIVFA